MLKITTVDVIELAQAVLKGAMFRVKQHHWCYGAAMDHDANICIYCGFIDCSCPRRGDHDAECPSKKARKIIDAACSIK